MIFDPSTADHLKPWLTKTLEPICDADPDALADYILALLKHNAPENELRKELASQLEEFLEKEGPPFIDTLFTALRTKSYLPYTSSPPPSTSQSLDNGIPIPLDALLSPNSASFPQGSRKRGLDYDEDLRPAKGPRLNQEGQYSRYGPPNGRGGHDGRGNGHWRGGGQGRGGYGNGGGMGMDGGDMGMGVGMGMNGGMGGMNGRGNQQYRPPDQKRGICRDYHNNGYCARGAYCKYSHGEDAVVPGVFPMGGQQMPGNMFMPMFPNGGAMPFGMGGGPAAYDPHEARLDMRPTPGGPMGSRPPRPPVLPRVRGENGDGRVHLPQASGELPVIQDLTPRDPKDDSAPLPNGSAPVAGPSRDGASNGAPGPIPSPMSGASGMDVDVVMDGPAQSMHAPQQQRGYRPMRGGRGAGAGRPGFFSGEVQRFRPERRNDKTLVVEKIPEDKLSLDAVNGWFKKFGTVTNVAIDPSSAKALVSFSTHEEAHAAWKSEDAVFSNRFVKLFWHRPMEGHGQTGQRMLAASAPLVASVSGRDHTPTASTSAAQAPTIESNVQPSPSPSAPPHSRKPSGTPSPAVSALAAKQQLLEQQIAEQKGLMDKLGTASPEEKKELFARLRKLGVEMKATTSSTPGAVAAAAAATSRRPSATPHPEDREQKERDRLDKELELHSVVNAIDTDEESTEALKAKLAKLKAEAASLGIDASAPSASYGYSTYRGRGRGRGVRGFTRGAMRGGPPRASMKLDNRPKKLLVKDVSSDSLQAVRDWYETTGQVDSVEPLDTGDVVVSFRTRSAAEQGLAKGANIPLAGQKQISWFTAPQSALKSAPKTESTVVSTPNIRADFRMDSDYVRSTAVEEPSHGGDEEFVASGWGDEDEDGMGML